jgi:hypothetical protein
VSTLLWELTEEGTAVLTSGSAEFRVGDDGGALNASNWLERLVAQVFTAVTAEGVTKEQLESQLGRDLVKVRGMSMPVAHTMPVLISLASTDRPRTMHEGEVGAEGRGPPQAQC